MKIKSPDVKCIYHEEPALSFGAEREHVCPKTGISLFGPRSVDIEERHPKSALLGLIGSGQSLASARSWIESSSQGVSGEGQEIDFPGFSLDRGFYTNLQIDNSLCETITHKELSDLTKIRKRKERFDKALTLLADRLRLLSQKDRQPDCIVLALPDEMVQNVRTVDFKDSEQGAVHRDLRRATKAVAMEFRMPTQILLQRTTEAVLGSKNIDHKATCAWNFFVGLYYKIGGIPWNPIGLTPGTCYVGVSFQRSLGSKNRDYFTSIAQAFDEHGNGLVLRGQDFTWNSDKHGKSPHLPEEVAKELISAVLKRYKDEMRQTPSRVVIHKTSQFWPEEQAGFEDALRHINNYDFLAVAPTSEIRILRDGRYPILRGSHVSIGDRNFLYSTGYIPALKKFPHGHVPSPLQVYDHIGDTSIQSLLYEILVLTKMNWNSAAFGGLMPITLKFSKLVGEIMKEIPEGCAPMPQFKFYM